MPAGTGRPRLPVDWLEGHGVDGVAGDLWCTHP